jgi:beta-glucuronidase
MAIRADALRPDRLRAIALAGLACACLLAGPVHAAPTAGERAAPATTAMTHVQGRQHRSLNGTWEALIDPYAVGIGDWRAVWKDRTPASAHEFVEYGFDDRNTLQVPGDFNTQRPELTWLEGSVWYRKSFTYALDEARRLFVHFGGANYRADVFLNGRKLGSHEGGFTPFQFELTDALLPGENRLLVHVDNARRADGVPARGFDWFNYGGLTRDVHLVEVPRTYIQDYFLQLAPRSHRQVDGWVRLAGSAPQQPVTVRIPELGVDVRTQADAQGHARVRFEAPFVLWTPERPKLYRVEVVTPKETLKEDIGFRNLAVRGDEILLNGESLFLRGVNLHEEIDGRRATSEADAQRLLERARKLGANFVRLVHYPHNEHLVRLADRMGLLLWQELPVYQGIDFAAAELPAKLDTMLEEMIARDRNRASVALWGIANETAPSAERNAVLSQLAQRSRALDPTRPVAAAFYAPGFDGSTIAVTDPLVAALDVVGVNEYFGWYAPWPVAPEAVTWKPFGKPLLISEFGAEARLGNRGADDVASEWNEEFQAAFYRRQFRMLKNIPFQRGVVPWVMMDFRSPVRMHPHQGGFNRKGLLSEDGEPKLAWQVIRDYYLEAAP